MASVKGNDKTRTPGPWTTFVELVHGLPLWTTDHSSGPLSWTTLVDHLRDTRFWGLKFLTVHGKMSSSGVQSFIIIVETLHKMWSSKYMTIVKYKCAMIRLKCKVSEYMPLKLVVFFPIATENGRKAVTEFQKLIFLGEDLQALKGDCNLRLLQFKWFLNSKILIIQ
jgi:hypothetical protein